MTQYNLNYKGSDVDLAIEKSLAHLNNIDTTPSSPSTKAVTSEGIKAALDGKLASSALVTNFNSPNNTTVPSSEAVKDVITTGSLSVCRYTLDTLSGYNPPDSGSYELDMSQTYDPADICTLSGGDRIEINGGTGAYLISFSGEYRQNAAYQQASNRTDHTFKYEINGHVVYEDLHEGVTSYRMVSHTHVHYLSNDDVIRITGQASGTLPSYSRVSVRNAHVFIMKLSV